MNVLTKSLQTQNAANIIFTIVAELKLVHTQVHLRDASNIKLLFSFQKLSTLFLTGFLSEWTTLFCEPFESLMFLFCPKLPFHTISSRRNTVV